MKGCAEDDTEYQDATVYLNLSQQVNAPHSLAGRMLHHKDIASFALKAEDWKIHIAGDVLGSAEMLDAGVTLAMLPIMNLLALLMCALMVAEGGKIHARLTVMILDEGCLLSAARILEALATAYNLDPRASKVRVFIEIHLPSDSDLSTTEEVFNLLRPFCPAFANVLDATDGSGWKSGTYNAEINLLIRVVGVTNEWLMLKLGVDRRRRRRRGATMGTGFLLMQDFHYGVEGVLQYGDDPQPVIEQYQHTK
ncbi:hypothetical protein QFC20_007383 [Naganishia adeliensis]|uniref:Uncharacterized protein n=1 Tax=Naganishia adeliensis TaxID=92952 RepID=A0ACC2UZA4_9TREE|nr:hypothetical protein QFC20_007383 [Naganishia adeliensis]